MPETSIVITAQDRYSEAIKKMSTATQSFKKNVDSLENGLQLLSKTKTTLRLDVKDAKRALDEAEKQFRTTRSEADGLKLELAQANYDGAVRQLNLVTKAARDTEKQLSKTSSKAGRSGSFGQNVTNALAVSGIGDTAKKLLSDGANAAAGSLWGSEGGTLFSNALSTAATGASAGFMMGGPFGAAVGGLIGAGAGLISGSIQNWAKKDDAFKSYYQEAYETQISAQESSLVTGSALAAQREPRRVMQQHGQARTGNRPAAGNSLFLTVSHSSPQASASLSGLLKIFRFPALRRSSLEIRGQALTNFHVRCIIIQNCWLRPACDDHWGSSRKQK